MNFVTQDCVTEALLFDIDNHGHHFLKEEYKVLNKLCGLVHGSTKRKAQDISESEWSFMRCEMFPKTLSTVYIALLSMF